MLDICMHIAAPQVIIRHSDSLIETDKCDGVVFATWNPLDEGRHWTVEATAVVGAV